MCVFVYPTIIWSSHAKTLWVPSLKCTPLSHESAVLTRRTAKIDVGHFLASMTQEDIPSQTSVLLWENHGLRKMMMLWQKLDPKNNKSWSKNTHTKKTDFIVVFWLHGHPKTSVLLKQNHRLRILTSKNTISWGSFFSTCLGAKSNFFMFR